MEIEAFVFFESESKAFQCAFRTRPMAGDKITISDGGVSYFGEIKSIEHNFDVYTKTADLTVYAVQE